MSLEKEVVEVARELIGQETLREKETVSPT
jgi:hypothetical protein